MTITENDLLEAIYREEYLPPFDPAQHVTKQQIADKLQLSIKAVDDVMKRWLTTGRAQRVTVRMPNGRRLTVYAWKDKG